MEESLEHSVTGIVVATRAGGLSPPTASTIVTVRYFSDTSLNILARAPATEVGRHDLTLPFKVLRMS